MWVFTTDGFFSVVQHDTLPNALLVRVRAKADALNLIEWLGDHDRASGIALIHTPTADYEWRMVVPRHAWAEYMVDAIRHVDYPNFKNAVAQRQGLDRADIYHDVWGVMHEFQMDNRE